MLVEDFLQESAARLPEKVALVCEGARLTYAQIDARANCLAHALMEHGIRRGDRVAIHLGNSPEAVIAIFAILRAGGVFVSIHPAIKPARLVAILSQCVATALFIRAENDEALAHFLGNQTPSLKCIFAVGKHGIALRNTSAGCYDFLSLTAVPVSKPESAHIDLDLACLIYTSGSTGEPKGVMCDHSSMVFAAQAISTYLGHSSEDVILSVLPLSYSYGLYQLLTVFQSGGTLILENALPYPAQILQRLVQEKATGFPGVPTLFSMLAKMDLSGFDLASLRYMTNAAAALAPSFILELRSKLPATEFYSMHGLTEVVRTVYLRPELAAKKPGSVGRAMPGTEVWLEDETGRRVEPDETGEMVIRGHHVMRGYWNDPEGSAERFRPGLLPGERLCFSGDLFRMDQDGDLFFVGRKDDMIKCRGQKVFPKPIEDLLCSLPAVVEAAVIGVPDPMLGQAVKAFIVCKGAPPSAAQVLSYCRVHLEDHMIPKYVEFRDELPKTVSGKISKINLS